MKIWDTRSGYRITRLLAGRSNVFLLANSKVKVLVDSSTSKNWKKLEKALDRLGVNQLDFLVLTHTHFDHAGNAQNVKKKFNPKVVVHQTEADILRKGISIIPKGTNWVTRIVVNPFGRRIAPKTNFQSCEPDFEFNSIFQFNQFGLNAYLLHTPGHSEGSVSLIVDDEIALVGDAMFGVLPGSIYPPFADNTNEMVKSWGKLLNTNCNTYLPSHGSAILRSMVIKNFKRLSLNYTQIKGLHTFV